MFIIELQKYKEATKEQAWIKVMDEEIKMIKKNHTWKHVKRPKNKEVISLKWVYKIKYNDDVSTNKLKAHLVAKGYS